MNFGKSAFNSRHAALRTTIAAAVAAALLAACAGTPKQESTGEFIDDSVITTKVKSALLADKTTSAVDINVDTFKGRVLLSGFVKGPDERQRAEGIARKVPGVKQVNNNLEIR